MTTSTRRGCRFETPGKFITGLGALFCVFAVASAARAADETHLYWGNTHLHTSFSTDGYAGGNTSVDPELAYRYARGIPVIHPTVHIRVRIERPLDFLVVSDHAELYGFQAMLDRDDPRMLATAAGRRLRELQKTSTGAVFMLIQRENGEVTLQQMLDLYKPVEAVPWNETIDAAERNNIPGKFTAFAGWEWSSTPNGRNLHRVIFSPAPADALRKLIPYSWYDSQRPEDLWAWLQKESKELNTDFIAIPHNSNMSDGLMFQGVDSDGRPITADYARTRSRWERVMEVTQIKGTSEVSPELSPNDEFANFEIYHGLFSRQLKWKPNKGDYARYALMLGLKIEHDVGVNPYKFGMIGSTDVHVGLASADEDDFFGAVARGLLPEDRNKNRSGTNFAVWGLSASGYAAVWAKENTREAIFAAFKRKEVYATTGTRIQLRVFGGFNFRPSDSKAADVAGLGYERGVPMGGDLTNAPGGKAPALLIRAVKDPDGANLDRVQVVKGWLDKAGETHEKVYTVAWSGDRKLDANGTLPAVGNTVDLTTAKYANTIGAPELAVVWEDPDFDPAQRAFYYVRVLEIPTPRQQVYDAVALGLTPDQIRDIGEPPSIQERAYSSPIWYTPSKK
jgi:hypothetical protein